jgi:antitoxin component of RelBE/YafQ-DinJ toxin-antitoxin module
MKDEIITVSIMVEEILLNDALVRFNMNTKVDMATVIRIFLQEVIHQKKIPFDVSDNKLDFEGQKVIEYQLKIFKTTKEEAEAIFRERGWDVKKGIVAFICATMWAKKDEKTILDLDFDFVSAYKEDKKNGLTTLDSYYERPEMDLIIEKTLHIHDTKEINTFADQAATVEKRRLTVEEEVDQWKAVAHERSKNLTNEERVKYINARGKAIAKKYGFKIVDSIDCRIKKKP